MRLRAPSPGFVYLCLAVAAFVAFFVWLRRPMWWELEDSSASDRGEAGYLMRIAAKAEPEQRARWLGDALAAAARCGDRELVRELFVSLRSEGVALRPSAASELLPGTAWLLAVDGGGWSRGASSALLVVDNREGADLKLQLEVFSQRSGKGYLAGDVAAPVEFGVDVKEPAQVTCSVAAGKLALLDVRAAAGNFARPDATGPGLKVGKVEVVR